MNNDVLIIGNGFDLYHKLPTRYTDFLVVVENWAEFWTLYRNNIKIEETENEVERETFSVSLGENGRLTQRALQDFANHAANLNSRNLEELNDIIYGNRNINQHHQVHGSLQQDDMVLGVRDDAFENWDYIYFQKFFQRIQKRTGAFYKAWIPQIRRSVEDAPIKVFIMGHSLGMTDKEILKEFFYGKYVSEITIYYHNQYAYEQLVISLFNMFGKEFVIEQTGSNRIKFIQLDFPIKVSVENEMIF